MKMNMSAGLPALVAGLAMIGLFVGSDAAAVTTAADLEPNDSFATAQLIAPHDGAIEITGNRGVGDDDFFAFFGNAGDVVTIRVTERDLGANFFFDSLLTLFLDDGSQLAENDDAVFGDSLSGSLIADFALPETTRYAIRVSSIFGLNSFDYSVEVTGLSVVSKVPTPAALPLAASAIGLFGLLGWKRRRALS